MLKATDMADDISNARALLCQISDKWTIAVLEAICDGGGKARFNVIKRATDGITQKTLTQCLRRLERNGIIKREILNTTPIGVLYSVTALGKTLEEPFRALSLWATENLPEVERSQEQFDQLQVDA